MRDALAVYGDALVPELEDALGDAGRPIELRRELPAVLARFGTASAGDALARHLLEPDAALAST